VTVGSRAAKNPVMSRGNQNKPMMLDVNAFELFHLGRKLMKLAEQAMPPSRLGNGEMITTVRLVMFDILSHPGSSVSEITERTGFPQSQVSLSVARLRELGSVVTAPDPGDRRKTLVRPAKGVMERGIRHASVPVYQTIADTLGSQAQDQLPEVLAALELLSELITPGMHSLAQAAPADAT
jgi:DNA-binding transcriptional regulator GbsR (MarR family)